MSKYCCFKTVISRTTIFGGHVYRTLAIKLKPNHQCSWALFPRSNFQNGICTIATKWFDYIKFWYMCTKQLPPIINVIVIRRRFALPGYPDIFYLRRLWSRDSVLRQSYPCNSYKLSIILITCFTRIWIISMIRCTTYGSMNIYNRRILHEVISINRFVNLWNKLVKHYK